MGVFWMPQWGKTQAGFGSLRPQKSWVRRSLLFSLALVSVLTIAPASAPATAPLLRTVEQLTPDFQTILESSPVGTSSAPVRLDGQILFRVTPSVLDKDAPSLSLTAQERAQRIEANLRTIVKQAEEPRRLAVTAARDNPNCRGAEVADSNGRNPEHERNPEPIVCIGDQYLMTVTSRDAQLEGHGDLSLRARQLEHVLEQALEQYHQQRQPEYLWRQVRLAAGLLLALLLTHYAIAHRRSQLRRRRRQLSEMCRESEHDLQDHDALPTTSLRERFQQQEQRGWLDFQRALLKLAQLAAWIGGAYYLLGLFPYLRSLQPIFLNGLRLPFRICILALMVYWLLRLGNRLLDRLFLILQEGPPLAREPSQRLRQRFSTFSQVSKGVLGFVLLLAATLTGLTILGVQVGPLLTGAGLVGLAISLASQNLIQDMINGFLILMEDQYGVGDIIIVGEVSGFVETMNLRITQLRNEEGRLITIPNSQIKIVQNLSKEWSRVDLMIPVALHCDIDAAIALIEKVAHQLHQDTTWGQMILEPPLLLGVDQLNHGGATIRLWIKTLPLKQWEVAREFRRRLKQAFDKADIDLGAPQHIIHVNSWASPETGPPSGKTPISAGASSAEMVKPARDSVL